MDFVDEIYSTIEIMIQRYISKMKISQQVNGVVVGESKKGSHRYRVKIKEHIYDVKDGIGLAPAPNTSVWVTVPNNDWNLAYICAGRNAETGFVTEEELKSTRAALEKDIQDVYDECVSGGAVINPTNLTKVIKAGDNITITETIDKLIISAEGGGSGGGSDVSYEQILPTGTVIGRITIDGDSTTIFAPSGGSGGGRVEDVYVDGNSVVDENDIAQISMLGYATTGELQYEINNLRASFQVGVDRIYDACVRKGSTPASHSLADVITAIYQINSDPIIYTEAISSNEIKPKFISTVEVVE